MYVDELKVKFAQVISLSNSNMIVNKNTLSIFSIDGSYYKGFIYYSTNLMNQAFNWR